MPRWWAIIPARWGSRRLPGKVLAHIGGRSLLEHVWRATAATPEFHRVVVATDDSHVAEVARGFGAEVERTGWADSGTARAAQVASEDVAVAVVQADQLNLEPASLTALIATIEDAPIATLWTAYTGDPQDPARVKIRTEGVRVLDFARTVFPDAPLRQHVGLYAFAPGWLARCVNRGRTLRAHTHDLEQLSWLDAGYSMAAREVADAGWSVDTPAQLAEARAVFAERT
ncbi:MAG: NTP transferase domain-containing protein [Myxococcota bacterium]